MPVIRPVPIAMKMAPISRAEPGGRAEADETECARYRYSRAHIAVDHHDDHTDNRGQKCQCDSKAFWYSGFARAL